MMDCKKCHAQCKAVCCSTFPMEKSFYEEHKDKIVTQPVEVHEFTACPLNGTKMDLSVKVLHIVALTSDSRCCFLNKDLSCNVYENRPYVCKKFGDESSSFMTCVYQSPDGRVRSRQERRACERKVMELAIKQDENIAKGKLKMYAEAKPLTNN